MMTRAGFRLYRRKPTRAAANARAATDAPVCPSLMAYTTKNAMARKLVPPARPSRPSARLTVFPVARTAKIVTG